MQGVQLKPSNLPLNYFYSRYFLLHDGKVFVFFVSQHGVFFKDMLGIVIEVYIPELILHFPAISTNLYLLNYCYPVGNAPSLWRVVHFDVHVCYTEAIKI